MTSLVEQVEGAIAAASNNEARALAAIAEVEHWLVTYLKRCARDALNSGSDFNQGVVRGLEIAAAQVEHSHYWNRPPSERKQTSENGQEVSVLPERHCQMPECAVCEALDSHGIQKPHDEHWFDNLSGGGRVSMTPRWKDPDETRGRALYRAYADAEARRSISMARRKRLHGFHCSRCGVSDYDSDFVTASCEHCDSDGSGEAGETPKSGSTRSATARVRKDIAQTPPSQEP